MKQEHPMHVIQKHCQPLEMLAYLLAALQSNHMMQGAVGGFAHGAQNKASVFAEIQGLMGLMTKSEAPTSMLATIEMIVQVNHMLDSANSQNLKAPQEHRDGLARKAHAEKTLLQILRELLNKAETQGLESALLIEAMHKKHPPTNEPEKENDPDPPTA
jgi:hypothetical protein